MASSLEKGHPPHANCKFRQQKLASFYPKHSPIAVSIAMFMCALILIPIGILVISVSESIFEKRIRYDHISKCTFRNNHGLKKFAVGKDNNTQGCRTILFFTIDKAIPASVDSPLFMYYRINGYYQMHRRYQKSRDDVQLLGNKKDKTSISSDCMPFRWPGDVSGAGADTVEAVYSPCGMIAWSMFNDTLNIYKVPDDYTLDILPPHSSRTPVCLGGMFSQEGEKLDDSIKCTKKGIALDVDVKKRFQKAAQGADVWTGIPSLQTPTDYRSAGYYAGEPGHSLPIATDEDFMVWSRTAPFPEFSKLYRRIEDRLQAGQYALEVEEYYDTTSFGAEKYLVLQSSSWLGGKHILLGGALLALGCFGFIVGMACCILHIFNQSKMKR
eukprot:Tbor_TRINITY_DN5690_c4_g1::TRINITY_DN5690_c4_g1_i1::g.9363::m.9363